MLANDIIHFRKNNNLDLVQQKIARLNPGYYNIDTLATEIARAMTEVSFMPQGYLVNYNSQLGRYEFSNESQRFWFFFLIYSKETQDIGAKIISTLFHALLTDAGLGASWA